MKTSLQLRAGEWVEVRNKDEVLATLDKKGQLDGMPFMPEMFTFCGQRFRVYKRAHKTCDTATGAAAGIYKGRKLNDSVHLDGIRCDGRSHGGCEAGCLIFWKEAWLRRSSDTSEASIPSRDKNQDMARHSRAPGQCTEDNVLACTTEPAGERTEPTYVCQATRVPAATEPLSEWDLHQYFEDFVSGNVGAKRMANGFIYMAYKWLAGRLPGGRVLRWLYDVSAGLRRGFAYPRKRGTIPPNVQTPTAHVDLKPGDLVRVKSYEAILATCDNSNKNRGMTFDAEMVPYCGQTFRVLKRVTKILNESTGRMQEMRNPCIILDGVFCQSRYSECRLFCPRSIYPYWREIWLERVVEQPAEPTSHSNYCVQHNLSQFALHDESGWVTTTQVARDKPA